MQILFDFFINLSHWSRSYLPEISLAILATLMVIYGATLNRAIKRNIRQLNFILRTSIFILVCALGYGATLILVSPLLAQMLAQFNNQTLSPVLLLCFVLLGFLADRNN
ncbi:DUF3392 domain-containing protein [Aestuariirhabdus sp. Z084]|uniref:DUF3392 domain-containing protein n=1 Tax=Aestuariirhabdus haliotis TaxID=2918751 RepID=UPI00201B45DC|nr:DUF3392 domain-containing protein [Aestuariirhabdus haliotis]MCL6414154.1 DUF3392 domain-containing protein [Aestuariirhabdus haliotis]MCL6418086.1 DUF3392 domain-containing protein [Aestuariirhabdus haliotis]